MGIDTNYTDGTFTKKDLDEAREERAEKEKQEGFTKRAEQRQSGSRKATRWA
jgi:hypothetical protein